MKWNIIFSGDYNFAVLKTMYSTYDQAWNTANKLAERYEGIFEHYDVLSFDSEKEMFKYIMEQAKTALIV